MKKSELKLVRHGRRKLRIRRRVNGTQERPRLTVFRSNKNLYAQIIDDVAAKTLVAASTKEKGLAGDKPLACNKASAKVLGTRLAEKALQVGIKQVVFDRNGYTYHGRVKELAEAARKGGLQF